MNKIKKNVVAALVIAAFCFGACGSAPKSGEIPDGTNTTKLELVYQTEKTNVYEFIKNGRVCFLAEAKETGYDISVSISCS